MTTVVETAARKQGITQVGLVDCDTHNYWDSWDELFPYLSERWQKQIQTYGTRHYAGGEYPRFWADPDDKLPPSGRRPGADVGFMGTDHLDRHNVAYAMLIPLTPVTGMPNLDFANALASAINDWQIEEWLNKDERLRASLVVATEDAAAAAAEIRRVAPDGRFSQVAFGGRPQSPMGNRRYWPIYEACEEFNLPIMSHAFGSSGNPITGTGWASFYIEDHVGPAASMQANVASLVLEGVFERFPSLRAISVENGFGWVPALAWRMDSAFTEFRDDLTHLSRKPSEYLAEHVYFATQPVEEPERREYFQQIFEMFPPLTDRLVFSSDYPHWDGDEPSRALPLLRDPEIREKVVRAAKVKIRAQDEYGKWFEAEGEELLSRCFQHEIDHLDGVLFIFRISSLKRDLALRKIRKMQRAGEW